MIDGENGFAKSVSELKCTMRKFIDDPELVVRTDNGREKSQKKNIT